MGSTIRAWKFLWQNAKFFYGDILRYIWCSLTKENYVGRRIHILTKGEAEDLFGSQIAGGCTHGMPMIDLFMHPDCVSNEAELAADIITHECMHQVLFLRVGYKEMYSLDKIHFLCFNFFGEEKLPEVYAEFVTKLEKKTKHVS